MRLPVAVCALLFISNLSFANDIYVNSGGKEIVLHDDYTWEYSVKKETGNSEVKTLTRNQNATMVYKNKNGKYQISIDPNIWNPTHGNNDEAEFQFVNNDQNGYSVVIFEGLTIPLDSMKKLLIVNANQFDSNASIIDAEKCIVNDTEGELVTYSVVVSGLDVTFFTFIASKDSGTIQFTFYTLSNYFEKMKPQFLDAISGLEF
jgi:hypothetical protein